jgi:single-strand DNA-binding protein
LRSVNRVTLMGHVGSEPEIRTTGSGTKVAKFSLATSYKSKDGDKTQWHRITAWAKTADIVEQYVSKGDPLYIEGSIEYSTTEDENGKPRYWTDIVAREINMLKPAPKNGGGRATPSNFDPDEPY